MNKPYWEGRKETTLQRRYGSYIMTVRHLADCDKAQVSIEDISLLRFPLLWSRQLSDQQAHAAMALFESIGYFDMPI